MSINNTIEQISLDKCVGCKLCENLCPRKAIEMFDQKDGFQYPNVNDLKCINCGLCINNCIVNPEKITKILPFSVINAYKLHTYNDSIRMNSTSGGAYYSIAKAFLDNGDYICACAYNDKLTGAVHIIGNDLDTLRRTMRSKYFQSDMTNIYASINELIQTKKILFVGTPCQVEAIRTYCKDNDNLFTCDFICRGVNSPKAFRCMVKNLEEKYKSKVVSVHFKNKNSGWNLLSTNVIFENGENYFGTRFTDPWINGYIGKHLYMRKSCYNCSYTTPKRFGDITVGDFWGDNTSSKQEVFAGISCVMVNNNKGAFLVELMKKYASITNVDFNTVIRGNGCLNGSTLKIPKEREEFFENCDKEPFDKLVYKLLGWNKKKLILLSIKSRLLTIKNRFGAKSSKLRKLIAKNLEDIKI